MNRQQRLTLLATIVGSGIVILDSTVVNLALPHISHSLHASFADLQWIADGYLLSLSALILLGGSLGDIFGRKRIYLIGLLGFGVASLLCGLAPNAAVLIITRVLQGIFGALLVPGGLAIINTNFPAEERGAAIGSWSAWSAVFAALGPLLGGYILGVTSWRWIFLINVPLVVLCYLLGSVSIKEGKDSRVRRVDYKGAIYAMFALAGITYGLIEGPANHWRLQSVAPLIEGLVIGAVFLRNQKRSKDPMVHLDLFKSRNFTGSNIMTFGMYGALGGFFFALVIFLQTTAHYSAIRAGLSLIPVTVLLVLFSKRVGKLSSVLGPRMFMTFGPLIAAAGILSLIRLSATNSSYMTVVLPGVVLFAAGLTLLVAPLTTTVMTSVSDANSGIASGINNAVSRVAGLIVIAVLGLFGSAHVYHFAIYLCAAMAASSGIISWLTIENPKPAKTKS
ncbi:MAG TPA: MFS transporter [Candidatus Saccharimonadales bacterium]|nr:MFS transporter [Candidatus Saccharimonadales bacterium]